MLEENKRLLEIKAALLFFFLEVNSMYLSPKVCNHALPDPAALPRGFQEAQVQQPSASGDFFFLALFCVMINLQGQRG